MVAQNVRDLRDREHINEVEKQFEPARMTLAALRVERAQSRAIFKSFGLSCLFSYLHLSFTISKKITFGITNKWYPTIKIGFAKNHLSREITRKFLAAFFASLSLCGRKRSFPQRRRGEKKT